MTGFRKMVRRLYEILYEQPKARREISRLYREDDPRSKSLANALRAFVDKSAGQEEQAWIARIETLRNELNDSDTEISITDYGAGSAGVNLTAEEEYEGRVVTRSIGEVCRTASKLPGWAFLLFKLIRELMPSVCLELGTCLGISAAYQAAALELNRRGRIVTLEGAEALASLAKENLKRLGLERVDVRIGRFRDILAQVLREQGRVDFVFIDGHHDEHATLAYFDEIYPFLSEGAAVVFDDISWSRGMERAWVAIASDERIRVSVDMRDVGICIMAGSPAEKKSSYSVAAARLDR